METDHSATSIEDTESLKQRLKEQNEELANSR